MGDRVTTVYQYFDELGRLLYVGITNRGPRRAHEHAATKAWWEYATGCWMEHKQTRDEALQREAELIERHNPPFNIQHNPRPRSYKPARMKPSPTPSSYDAAQAAKRRWWEASAAERVSLMCVVCGLRPGSTGPTCDPCRSERKAFGRARAASREAAA